MVNTALPMNRRHALLVALAALSQAPARAVTTPSMASLDHAPLADLERKARGRLGVALLDTGTGRVAGHRLEERFGMCSTFKLPLAAAVLRKIDQGTLQATQWVPFSQSDMLEHAPVTQANLHKGGMTVTALAQAAQTTSDNPAANLLLGLLGGPAGFTAMLREAGDSVTRLDRMEPHMNSVTRDDPRDTTTPAAMAHTTVRLLTGDWLSAASKTTLIDWMVATETGAKRLRAGFPPNWRAGDKTGTGMSPGMPDKYNDIAITWPPGRSPIVVTAYYETARTHSGKMSDEAQRVLAEVGRIAARWAP